MRGILVCLSAEMLCCSGFQLVGVLRFVVRVCLLHSGTSACCNSVKNTKQHSVRFRKQTRASQFFFSTNC